ncbi:hypothetical protein WMY93_000810 [Mugilogobius chulae]|uniref:Uncharacterized protein n=1 Tax=Mugilogobius chulae TaxID=88201 RepID=A0AAW0Q331_9GOBI
MAGSSEKIPIPSSGPEDLQQFLPPAYSAVAVKPTATGRLIKAGIAVLIAGALLLLLGQWEPSTSGTITRNMSTMSTTV